MPQIAVTFDVDADGILSVTAKDKASGKEQSIRIEGSGGLSKEEIDRMKKEAETNAADDLKKAEGVKVRNEADNAAYQVEAQLKEHGEKVPAEERSKIEASINNLRETLKGDDTDAIKKAQETLMQDAQTIGKIVYEEMAKQQSGEGAAATAGAPNAGAGNDDKSGGDDNVIDAEFEVKDAKT